MYFDTITFSFLLAIKDMIRRNNGNFSKHQFGNQQFCLGYSCHGLHPGNRSLPEHPYGIHPDKKVRTRNEGDLRQDLRKRREERRSDHPVPSTLHRAGSDGRYRKHRRSRRSSCHWRSGSGLLDVDLGHPRHVHKVLRSNARCSLQRDR